MARPAKFENLTPDQLEKIIDEYFELALAYGKPFTITGLAFFLNTTRETLLDYEKNNKKFNKFSDTIKRAKLRCQLDVEERLFGSNVAGPIFNLKNNYGWRDEKHLGLKIDPTENAMKFAQMALRSQKSGKSSKK